MFAGGPPPATSPATPGKATAALVLSILSFVFCPVIPAIVALVLAAGAKREISASHGRLGGQGVVKASRIISVLNIAMWMVLLPVLVALVIPALNAAKDVASNVASDAAVQSDLRSTLSTEKVFFASAQAWTDDPEQLSEIDSSIRYEAGDTPVAEDVVYVVIEDSLLGLSAKAGSGTCFYLMSDASDSSVGYAEDEDCGPTQDQDYASEWSF